MKTHVDELAMTETFNIRGWEAEMRRLKGLLLMQQARRASGDSEPLQREAETFFRQAIQVADRQHAALLCLRATIDRCRLLQAQTLTAEAIDLLSGAILRLEGRTGPDTQDSRTVRSLLRALAIPVQNNGKAIGVPATE